jgi:hypothetical protein
MTLQCQQAFIMVMAKSTFIPGFLVVSQVTPEEDFSLPFYTYEEHLSDFYGFPNRKIHKCNPRSLVLVV